MAHQSVAHPARVRVGVHDVRHLDRLARHHRPADGAFPVDQRGRPQQGHEVLGKAVGRAQAQRPACLVELVDGAAVGLGEVVGARRDGGEHAVEVQRRRDRPADLAQRLQLAHRARELGGTRLQLLEQAHVLDGDDGLVGEGLKKRDLLLGEGPDLGAVDHQDADGDPFPEQRRGQTRSHPVDLGGTGEVGMLRHQLGQVRFLRRLAVENRPAARQRAGHRIATGPHRPLAARQPEERIALDLADQGPRAVRQARRRLGDRPHHGLDVGRRARNHAKDVARRRLLLQRLGDGAVLLLQLLEQAHVLDGDDRLVREGLEQRDLLVGERAHFLPPDVDGADRHPLAHQRHRHDGSELQHSPSPRSRDTPGVVSGAFMSSTESSALPGWHGRSRSPRWWGGARPGSRGPARSCATRRIMVPFHPVDEGIRWRRHSSRRVLGHGIEDGLDIGRRAADHAQNLRGRRLLLQ